MPCTSPSAAVGPSTPARAVRQSWTRDGIRWRPANSLRHSAPEWATLGHPAQRDRNESARARRPGLGPGETVTDVENVRWEVLNLRASTGPNLGSNETYILIKGGIKKNK